MRSLMYRWQAVPLAAKLAVTPVIAALALGLVAAAGWRGLAASQSAADDFNDARLPASELVGDLQLRVGHLRETAFQVMTQSAAGFQAQRVEQSAQRLVGDTAETLKLLQAQADSALWSEEEKSAFARLAQHFSAFAKSAADAVDMRDMGLAAAAGFLTTADQHYERLQTEMEALRQVERQRAQASADASRTATQSAQTVLVGVGLAGLALAVSVALAQARGMRRRLGEASDWAGRIASGDLRLPPLEERLCHSRDDSDRLLVSLTRAGDGLTRLIGDIQQTSEGVAQAAQQIAQGNQELSSRTESAAASLQQTHASTEQIRATVDDNARRAHAAEQLAAATAQAGRAGYETAARARTTLQALSRQTGRITDLISAIERLAAQTHLLSLNAAVEAARAGAAGRGFGVVAGEVRTLAQRSSELSAEIRQVVGESVSAIAEGAQGVEAMHGQMGRILEHAQHLAQDMQGISSASRNQASEVNAIHKALGGLDTDTQGNAALVEQASAAAQMLRAQSETLQSLVAGFQLRRV